MVPRVLVVVALLSSLSATAAPVPADAPLIDAFVALLEKDDTGAIGDLAPESVDAVSAWFAAVEVMDRYDCIDATLVSAEIIRDSAVERVWRVAIAGRGLTIGGIEREETLPDVWYLTTVPVMGGWRIAEVATAEERLADALIAAPSDDVRRALVTPTADVRRLTTTLAWRSAEVAVGHAGFAALRFAHDLAASAGLTNEVAYVKQMESVLFLLLQCREDAAQPAAESMALALAGGDPDTISAAWFTAGSVHWQTGNIPAAIDSFRRAATLADSMADPRRAVKAYANLLRLEHARGQLARALEAADEMDRLSRRYGWLQGQLDALMVRNELQGRLGNYEVAEQAAREAHALALKLRQREKVMMTAINLAGTLLDRRDEREEAFRIYGTVADETSFGLVAQLQLGLALEHAGRNGEAGPLYERIAALAEPHPDVAALVRLRRAELLLRNGKQERALELAQTARDHFAKAGRYASVRPWGGAAVTVGSALRKLGRMPEAEQAFEAAIAEIEEENESLAVPRGAHVALYGARTAAHHELIEMRVEQGRAADALRLAERIKAVVLDDLRANERSDVGARMTASERDEQRRVEEEIARLNQERFAPRLDPSRAAALNTSLAEARVRWETLETALHARHASVAPRVVVDPLQAPAALVPSASDVVLDYVVTPARTILFVLSRAEAGELRIETHTLPGGEEALRRDVDRFRDRLAGASFDYRDDARRLHRTLIAPAAKTLAGKKRVVVVADGPLWQLPFQALESDDGAPLVTRFALTYAPSLASLLRESPPAAERPAVLAIGNPRFAEGAAAVLRTRTRTDIGDLPEAATEAREIARLYDRERSRLLVGREATESALKELAGGYDVVHIAAHAVVDSEQPLYSSILLARSEGDDGLLEGREITRLPLKARLAVLSACSTARGRVRPGEGLIGLSWAFLVAGCPTIVATQWQVPSESTSQLMIDFHRELAGGATVAEALQRAQLRLRGDRRYRHPFYWSPFVVVGAGRG